MGEVERTRERVQVETPPDLLAAARERGWPDGLLERALAAGIAASQIQGFLHWRRSTTEDMERLLDWHERLTRGPLRGREATLADNEAFCDLWAKAPERIGDFDVTTERGPNGFAQFRLQENVNLQVIADGSVLVASCGWSRRNVLIAGRRVSVSYGQALRVHRDYRRQGFGDAVRTLSGPMNTVGPAVGQYDFIRAGNFAVVGWWKKFIPDFFEDTPQEQGQVPGIPVTVSQIPAFPGAAPFAEVRATRREDLPRCVELLNRTHGDLDLFRPYTQAFLEGRLDEGYWGERAPWLPYVYGWQDHIVFEVGGRVIACAGLWDRGRDQREHVRHRETGEERTVSDAALMDWGFETGAEDAMLQLLDVLGGRAHERGRTFLLAPLDQTPELAKRVQDCEPVPETRYLRWGLKDPAITRPYTDLAYW